MGARRPRPGVQELLDTLAATLESRLPRTWSVNVQLRNTMSARDTVSTADLSVRAPDGRTATVPVTVKQRLDPKDVASLVAQIRQEMGPDATEQPIVVAPYLSPRTRELLEDYNVGQTSPAGGMQITLSNPALFLWEPGPTRDPWAAPRGQPLRSLRGGVAGRVVRALCDFRPPYGVQELAERCSTPIASVSRVLSLLDREALITRAPGGAVIDVQWAELIRRWTEDYAFAKANVTATYLEPRGLSALLDKLRQTDLRYAVSGSMAASVLAPIAAPRLLSIYVEQLPAAARTLGLRAAERGANVMLAESFNPVAFERLQQADDIMYAAPSQVAADLLTGPGRSPAEGEALLQWMREHEDAWRS
jgi:hypothetical protein